MGTAPIERLRRSTLTTRFRRVASGMEDRGPRVRWARQENRRNGKAYEAAQATWSGTNAELQAMVVTACSYTGMGGGQLAPEVGLRNDETLLWTGTGVSLVDATAWPELRLPGYTALTADLLAESFSRAPSADLTTVDTGSVAVTDQRLIFVGESPIKHRREWAFDDLLGLVHLPDAPCTLLQVASEKSGAHRRMSGLLLTAEAVAEFRFVLALALAEGAGERAGFVAYLERLLDAHQDARPSPPSLVTARDAPSPVRLGLRTAREVCLGGLSSSVGSRTVRLVAAAATAFVLFSVALPGQADKTVLSAPPPVVASPTASVPMTLRAPDRVLNTPTTKPTTPQPGSRSTAKGQPHPAPRPTLTQAAPKPKPSATRRAPSPVPSASKPPRSRQQNPFPQRDGGDGWFCGAPPNPFQYTFCGGQYVFWPNFDVCRYFRCADDFWNDHGYLVVCADGKVTRTGGDRSSCTEHGGYRHTVYQRSPLEPDGRAHDPADWGPPAVDRDRVHRDRWLGELAVERAQEAVPTRRAWAGRRRN